MKKIREEKGAILIIALMLLSVLTLVGVSLLKSSVTENFIVRNAAESVIEFYNTEAALIDSIENHDSWFYDAFMNKLCDSAFSVFNSALKDDNGVSFAKIEIRCIEDASLKINELSDGANDLPIQPHISPPPGDSGLDENIFKIRRYAVTATSIGHNMKLQAGIWRAFKDDGSGQFFVPAEIYPVFNIYYWRQL